MQARELAVPGAWVFTPQSFPDSRGSFAAPFQEEPFRRVVGHPLMLGQANTSMSRRGVLRGIHYADVPPGQAKYIQCVSGSLIDVVVDTRVGSETFGLWDAVRMDSRAMTATYLGEGLGHAFLALEDHTVASYLCSTPYNPGAEHGVNPLDQDLKLPWEQYIDIADLVLSDKDRHAPTLREAHEAGVLPTLDACRAKAEELAS